MRVLGRTLRWAKAVVGEAAQGLGHVFRDRSRSARQQARQIANAARRKSEAAKTEMKTAYRRLVATSRATLAQARTVRQVLRPQTDQRAQRLLQTLERFLPRLEQALNQTVRRVFQEEVVPAGEKIVSLFEPHTAIIRRRKAGRETEFGRKVWLDEVAGGIISRWSTLEGNPPEEAQWQPALDHHVTQFGQPPQQASADRGLSSPTNEAYAHKLGVKYVVLPKTGRKSQARQAYERQPWFKRGRRYQAGIEGRISVLKRQHALDRCLDHGEAGVDKWVGWGQTF
ncbi:MAG: hypothetical protein L0332_17820 [Chloroflexi bacterium]|nr:hypothetical protein [Chloroflexota bacterium]